MAEVVGGAILSAVIKALVQSLTSPEVVNLFRKNKSLSKLLEALDVTLWSANSLLNDAEDKQVKDVNIKNWVDKLNEVLNVVDCLIDDINTEALRREIGSKGFLNKLIPSWLNFFDRKIKPEIEEVIARLDRLLNQKDRLGLKEGVQGKSLERSPAPLLRDYSSDVRGRDGDKEAILDLIFSKNVNVSDKISVIPIVGMGGVGKTTLARFIYDDSRVKNHFEYRAWVTVSDDFDVFKLATLVLEGLSAKGSEAKEIVKLGEELEKFLSGKKFFLVLDDVWNENYLRWISLKSYLQAGIEGSKIIVTTRNAGVASTMGSATHHALKTMCDDDCWKLFQKHAFHNVEQSVYLDLEKIGRGIVKKCKGLPLAVMSLAGVLSSVSDPAEWKGILESDVWELQKKGNDEILPSLWLSYSYLPSQQKRCFAYCSIFPKDHKFNKREMILMWMAEGFLQGENMEDDGERYIKTLLSRSLFERSTDDESAFCMHDLVHDLATFVSGKGFCVKFGMGDDSDNLTDKTRHLLCGREINTCLHSSNALSGDNQLRTFVYMSQGYPAVGNRAFDAFIRKFGCMRVLSLSRVCITNLPNSVGKLKHLRYLDLSRTSIKMLPDAIYSLYNLQTLLLRQCLWLTSLPSKMDTLINLRHVDISGTSSLTNIPKHMYELKALRLMTTFIVHRDVRRDGSECLRFGRLENIVDEKDVLEGNKLYDEMSLAIELTFPWDRTSERHVKHRAILDAMKPHPNLRKLAIRSYGGIQFSDWVADHSFSNITNVTISECSNCCRLPPFGQLPYLKVLEISRLRSIKTISSEFYGSSGGIPFKSLESLEIGSMDELQSWSSLEAESQAFPCLRKLSLSACPRLESTLPHSLPSLKELGIIYCPQMEALLPVNSVMSIAFPSLESLSISTCKKLEFLGFPLPTTLNYLFLNWIPIAHIVEWDPKSLEILGYQDVNMDSFVDMGLLPTSLVRLRICDAPNLEAIGGKVLQHLTSLEDLYIGNCPELWYFSKEGLPASLSRLEVKNCPEIGAIWRDWGKSS